MWTLIVSRYSYCRLLFGLAAVLGLSILVFLTVAIDEAEVVADAWLFVVVGGGFSLNFLLMTIDQKERRLLLWATLPLPAGQVAAARLLSVLLTQVAVGILAAAGTSLVLVRHGGDPRLLLGLLGAQGVALVMTLVGYLHDELTVWLDGRRWKVIVTGVGLGIGFMAVALSFEEIVLASWDTVMFCHAVAAALAAAIYALFVRRRSFLIGVDPTSVTLGAWREPSA